MADMCGEGGGWRRSGASGKREAGALEERQRSGGSIAAAAEVIRLEKDGDCPDVGRAVEEAKRLAKRLVDVDAIVGLLLLLPPLVVVVLLLLLLTEPEAAGGGGDVGGRCGCPATFSRSRCSGGARGICLSGKTARGGGGGLGSSSTSKFAGGCELSASASQKALCVMKLSLREKRVPQSQRYSRVPHVLLCAFQSDWTAYFLEHLSHFHFFSPCLRQKCFLMPVRSPSARDGSWWTQLGSGQT